MGSYEFFSGFFMQLHKLRSLRRSFLHFHFISAVHVSFISYIINKKKDLFLDLRRPKSADSASPGAI